MPLDREEQLQFIRKRLPLGVALLAIVILGSWGVFAYKATTAPAEGRKAKEAARSDFYVWLTVAVCVTFVGAPIAVLRTRRRMDLLQNGTEVDGRVASISLLRKHGARPVTYAYEVGGRTYKIYVDEPTIYTDRFEVGSTVRLLVDPRKPSRAVVLDRGVDLE